MADKEHPDPTGSEPPEEPSAAHDGLPQDNVANFPGKAGGTPLADRELEAEEEEDGQFAMGVIEGDSAVKGLKDLVKRNAPVEMKCAMMAAAVPLKALLDPEKEGMALVNYEPADYRLAPTRKKDKAGQKGIEKWVFTVYLRPTFVQDALSEGGLHALGTRAVGDPKLAEVARRVLEELAVA